MTDGVDDDLHFVHRVENEKGIWRRRQTANGGVIRLDANIGMMQKQVDHVFDASLNARRPLRRMRGDIVEIEARTASAGSV
jgi:hypothetical protein